MGKSKGRKKIIISLLFYHHILISEIEENYIYYCIDDYCMGRMGQKIRYKFQIKDFKKSTKLNDLKIELSDDSMIMIK